MKYTKNQRHKIYKEALTLLPDEWFICWAIDKVVGNFDDSEQEEFFPEFHLFAPREDFWIGNSWFGCIHEGMNARKTVLEFCIEMTKP